MSGGGYKLEVTAGRGSSRKTCRRANRRLDKARHKDVCRRWKNKYWTPQQGSTSSLLQELLATSDEEIATSTPREPGRVPAITRVQKGQREHHGHKQEGPDRSPVRQLFLIEERTTRSNARRTTAVPAAIHQATKKKKTTAGDELQPAHLSRRGCSGRRQNGDRVRTTAAGVASLFRSARRSSLTAVGTRSGSSSGGERRGGEKEQDGIGRLTIGSVSEGVATRVGSITKRNSNGTCGAVVQVVLKTRTGKIEKIVAQPTTLQFRA